MKYLSLDYLKETMPALSVTAPASHLSTKYVHIPTLQVVEDIMTLGWQPTSTLTTRGKHATLGTHGVTFSHPDLRIQIDAGDSIQPQVHLLNSYNGFSTLKFYAGFYRFICSNGLVVPMDIKNVDHAFFKVKHIHYDLTTLRSTMVDILENLSAQVKRAMSLSSLKMSPEEINTFIAYTYLRRIQVKLTPDTVQAVPAEILTSLNAVLRPEDEGNSAWKVLNRVQEKIIKGFTVYNPITKKFKTYKAITAFGRGINLNLDMYTDMLDVVDFFR